MRLDSSFYETMIKKFEYEIDELFKYEMIQKSQKSNFKNRGYFKLVYEYIPNKYKIVIENEIRTFDILIEDEEKASNSLYRIKHYNNSLDEENIIKAINLLKSVLETNNFNFYFYKDGKLYCKNISGVKRVKDLKELLNG